MRMIVVTGGDENYADLSLDMLASLKRHLGVVKFDIGYLDYGLSTIGRQSVGAQVTTMVKPVWPYRPHAQYDKQIQSLAFATRPFLPDYFPGYDAYAWIDSDAWVQDARGLAMVAAGSAGKACCVVPTIDRSYRHTPQSNRWVFERYRMAFGAETAHTLMRAPYIGSGVVGGGAASPIWKMWQARFQAALDRWDGPRLCDQSVLNHVVYLEDLPHHKLPATCNWVSHLAPPLADVKRGAMVEPSYPFDPVAIIHNSFNEKREARPFVRRDGQGAIECPLTYRGARAALTAAKGAAS